MTAAAAAAAVAAGLWIALSADAPRHALAVAVASTGYAAWRARRVGAPAVRLAHLGALVLLAGSAFLAMAFAHPARLNAVLAWLSWALLAGILVDLCVVRRPMFGDACVAATGALALVSGAALLAWLAGWRELRPLTPDGLGRLSWPFLHPNFLGAFCALLIPVALGTAVARRGHARLVGLAGLGAGGIALFASGSRAAWVGAVVGVLTLAAYGVARRRILVGVLGTGLLGAPVLLSRLDDGDLGAENARLGIWRNVLGIIAEHPLTGVGHLNLMRVAEPIVEQANAPTPFHAHSLPLNFAAEFGVLGPVALCALLIAAGASAHHAARTARGAARASAAGVAGGFVALVLTGLVDYPLADPRSTAAWWAVIALATAAGVVASTRPRSRLVRRLVTAAAPRAALLLPGLRRRWPAVAAAGGAAAGALVVIGLAATPTHEAEAALVVRPMGDETLSTARQQLAAVLAHAEYGPGGGSDAADPAHADVSYRLIPRSGVAVLSARATDAPSALATAAQYRESIVAAVAYAPRDAIAVTRAGAPRASGAPVRPRPAALAVAGLLLGALVGAAAARLFDRRAVDARAEGGGPA